VSFVAAAAPPPASVDGKNFRIEFDRAMHSRVIAKFDGKEIPIGDFAPSEFLTVDGKQVRDFALGKQLLEAMGATQRYVLTGTQASLEKTVGVTTNENEDPRTAIFDVTYTNTGTRDLHVSSWTNNAYSITGKAFWSYQSGSYEKRPDWVVPLKPGFRQQNFMGMNASDYGGGTPVSDVWRRDVGIGVGHLEMAPKLV
jgi:alpha-galactosidase